MDLDYLTLAVGCQMVQHMGHKLVHVHSFQQVYGGRIITDLIPECSDHITFDGIKRDIDHTVMTEPGMRLHVDDADLLLRAPLQLITGVKNVSRTPTTFAVVPPDDVLRRGGCDPEILREPKYKHQPPKVFDWSSDDVPWRPVLFGPKNAPCVQADKKAIIPFDDEAKIAWGAFHELLQQPEYLQKVILETGDVLMLDNYRMMHGREELLPVARQQDRRWVKRLWLSAALTDHHLKKCKCDWIEHPRIFDREQAFWSNKQDLHPTVPESNYRI